MVQPGHLFGHGRNGSSTLRRQWSDHLLIQRSRMLYDLLQVTAAAQEPYLAAGTLV